MFRNLLQVHVGLLGWLVEIGSEMAIEKRNRIIDKPSAPA